MHCLVFCLAISGLAPAVGYCLVFLSCHFGPRRTLGLQLLGIAWCCCLATSGSEENWGSSCRLCMYCLVFSTYVCGEAQKGPERPREAPRRPKRPSQRGPEQPRELQRGTETHREAQRGPERPMYVCMYASLSGPLWTRDRLYVKSPRGCTYVYVCVYMNAYIL